VGFDISEYKLDSGTRRKILNNCTEPEVGLHIFQEAFRNYQKLL
jgi:hypothetical protein